MCSESLSVNMCALALTSFTIVSAGMGSGSPMTLMGDKCNRKWKAGYLHNKKMKSTCQVLCVAVNMVILPGGYRE